MPLTFVCTAAGESTSIDNVALRITFRPSDGSFAGAPSAAATAGALTVAGAPPEGASFAASAHPPKLDPASNTDSSTSFFIPEQRPPSPGLTPLQSPSKDAGCRLVLRGTAQPARQKRVRRQWALGLLGGLGVHRSRQRLFELGESPSVIIKTEIARFDRLFQRADFCGDSRVSGHDLTFERVEALIDT
jgi:hypothetical protein